MAASVEPIRLYSNAQERERHEKLRDLFAIIKTCEHLERAWVRSAIPGDKYVNTYIRLLTG